MWSGTAAKTVPIAETLRVVCSIFKRGCPSTSTAPLVPHRVASPPPDSLGGGG